MWSAGAVVVVRNLGLISWPLERVFNEHVEIDAPTILSLVVIMGVGLWRATTMLVVTNDIQQVCRDRLRHPPSSASRARGISATTMLVVTNLNKFVVIAFGILFLGESRTWQAVLGCCAALGGGVWYAVARKNLAAKRAEAAGDAEAGKK